MAFAHPVLLVGLVLVIPLVGALEFRADGRARRRVVRAGMRSLLLALLIVALAEPELPRSTAGSRRLVVAIEKSIALGDQGSAEAVALARQAVADAARAGVPASVLAFGAEAGPSVALGDEGWLPPPSPAPGGTPRPAAGVAAARLAFRPGEDGTILLLASGHGSLSGLAEEAAAAAASGLRIRAEALPREVPVAPPTGPRITALDLAPRLRAPFDVRARFVARGEVDAEILVDGQSVARQSVPAAEGDGDGARDVLVPDLPAAPGPREVTLLLRDAGGHETLERRLVLIEAPPRAIVVEAGLDPHPAGRALTVQGFEVITLPPLGLASALAPTAPPPDVVLLDSDVAPTLPPAVAAALEARIEEGLGLVLLAGPSKEAWARLADSPLIEALPLLPLPPPERPEPPAPTPPEPTEPDPVESPDPTPDPGLRAERRPEEALPISLLLVIDRSGSMVGAKLSMAIEGARRAAATLSRHDRVGIITFADDATLDVPMTPARRLGVLGFRLAGLQAHGNTDIYGALLKARDVLTKEDAPIRHLIVLTDGQQTARRAVFSHLIEAMGQAGITLTAVGLGYSHDEQLLKSIAMWAPRGRYVPADTESQLPTIMTRDTQIVAEARRQEAEAMARIQDRNRPPTEDPVREREPDPLPQPRPPSDDTPSPPVDAPPAEGDALAPLDLARPHEATAGLDRQALPAVGEAQAARLQPGAALLMTRGTDAAALAAGRWGLGRVLMWTLPADSPGLAAWPDLQTFLVDVTRSVLAPAGSLTSLPFASVVPGPDGERLRLEAEAGAEPRTLRVTWKGAGRTVDLGLHTPGGEEDLALPELAAGARGQILLRPADAPGDVLPPLTYLARGSDAPAPQAGDARALAAALGQDALSGEDLLLAGAPAPVPTPRPLWPYALLAAVLLLPFDVWLHRRPGVRS